MTEVSYKECWGTLKESIADERVTLRGKLEEAKGCERRCEDRIADLNSFSEAMEKIEVLAARRCEERARELEKYCEAASQEGEAT